MPGPTAYEAQILLARAIVEVADGDPGVGVGYARKLAVLQDASSLGDPHGLRQPPPTPKAPNLADVITNRSIDNPEPQRPVRPRLMPGTRAFFEARDRKRQATGK
jgi:hypothetical protein